MQVAQVTVALGILAAIGCGGISQESSDCAASELFCGEQCVTPINDHANCGDCDNACAQGDVCGNGACQSECPNGQAECGGTCFDTSSDIDNCGGCGIACDAGNEECRNGECVIPCSRMLLSGVEDPWGYAWDGNERALRSHAEAAATCASFGGRLPTATELYRVSANETGIVGQTSDTNPLWTSARASADGATRMRLSDGGTDADLLENENYYRCTCEPEQPVAFTGAACYGSKGTECLALDVLGQRYNIDSWERSALTKREAIEDCHKSGAQLAEFRHYTAAIAAGSSGSGEYLHIADDARDNLSVVLRWNGNEAGTWVSGASNITTRDRDTRLAYRCVGKNFVSGTHPNAVTGEFVGRANGIKGEASDSGIATWAGAHDVCTGRGGHLPTSAEMAELIMHGLPGGSGVPLWTSDQAGFDGGTFRATMVVWTGVDENWFYNQAAGEATWLRQSESHPHRCIYYPFDSGYSGPADGDCSGGCTQVALSGGATMWFDSTDRIAAKPETAHFECGAAGGVLASERDLTEAIRGGLPNGSGEHVWTSDYANQNQKILRWTAVDTDFTDLYATYQTWSGFTADRPYRCMWTNELR